MEAPFELNSEFSRLTFVDIPSIEGSQGTRTVDPVINTTTYNAPFCIFSMNCKSS